MRPYIVLIAVQLGVFAIGCNNYPAECQVIDQSQGLQGFEAAVPTQVTLETKSEASLTFVRNHVILEFSASPITGTVYGYRKLDINDFELRKRGGKLHLRALYDIYVCVDDQCRKRRDPTRVTVEYSCTARTS